MTGAHSYVRMAIYQSKKAMISGSSLAEVIKRARYEYHVIQKKTPRRIPYIRSKYFVKDKIFINTFWEHLNHKGPQDKLRRLKLFACAIDLIRNSSNASEIAHNPNNSHEVLHRFFGISKDSMLFVVQIKEQKKTGRKDFVSVFPVRK